MRVAAVLWSSPARMVVNELFDATPWFEQATNEEIEALAIEGFGGDKRSAAADKVAEFFRDGELKEAFLQIARLDMEPECYINPEQAANWITQNRPVLADD